MARGWESKSVEQQQADATSSFAEKKLRLTPEQLEQQQERQGIVLSRQRILQQLEAAQNPRHREMLQAALSDLDTQLSRLG